MSVINLEKLRNLSKLTELSKLTGFREECPSDVPFSVSSDNLPLLQRFCSQGGRKKIILLFFPTSIQFSLGICSKTPLPLYSQETRIPGLRECVGVIIPNPCTLNRTFYRDLHTLAVLVVVYFFCIPWHWVAHLGEYHREG